MYISTQNGSAAAKQKKLILAQIALIHMKVYLSKGKLLLEILLQFEN